MDSLSMYFAIAENESVGRVKFSCLQVGAHAAPPKQAPPPPSCPPRRAAPASPKGTDGLPAPGEVRAAGQGGGLKLSV